MPAESSFVAPECSRVPCVYLLYHEIRPFPGQYSYAIEKRLFERHADMVAQARGDQEQSASAEFTFDDGSASDFEFALPVLSSRALRGHFFITVGFIGNNPAYMAWQQVRSLCDAGHIIGGHGWSHTSLTHCSQKELDCELRGSRETLEDKLGVPITTMSLPGGRYNRAVLAACREAGYGRVFTSEPRLETTTSEFTVGRVNVSANRTPEWIHALLQPHSRELANLHRQYRIKRTAKAVLGDWIYERVWDAVTGRIIDREVGSTTAHDRTPNNP